MTKFRPCIDLHEGVVKQIVGGTLRDEGDGPVENFVSEHSSAFFARTFRKDHLGGGHVIMLGPGNAVAAREALAAWPGGLQIGGGITVDNAAEWIAAGASQVLVTSWLFDAEGRFLAERAEQLADRIGRERVVIDLSCRRTEDSWQVAMNRWQTLTELPVNRETLARLGAYCGEFLIHAADVEGKCGGVDEDLVRRLGEWSAGPITYAGGVRGLEDVRLVDALSGGRVDVTVGSALDLFGGTGVRYADLVEWNQRGAGS